MLAQLPRVEIQASLKKPFPQQSAAFRELLRLDEEFSALGTRIVATMVAIGDIRNAMHCIQVGNGRLGPLLRPGCSAFTNAEWLRLMAAELTRLARAGGY